MSNLPSIGICRKHYGKDQVIVHISLAIATVVDCLQVGKKLGYEQFDLVSEMILERFPWINLSDINICFKNAIAGDYGKVYDRIDAQVILDWIRQYANNKADVAEGMNINKHYEATKKKEQGEPVKIPSFMAEFMQGLKGKDKPKKEETPRLPISKEQLFHAEIMLEFDQIWRNQNGEHDISTGRRIKVGDKCYTHDEFLKEAVSILNEESK